MILQVVSQEKSALVDNVNSVSEDKLRLLVELSSAKEKLMQSNMMDDYDASKYFGR